MTRGHRGSLILRCRTFSCPFSKPVYPGAPHDTLSGNFVGAEIDGTVFTGGSTAGGGIYTSGGSATLVATIVADNASGLIVEGSGSELDCQGESSPPVTDGGYNLDDDGSCGFSTANGSLPDTPADSASSSPQANGGPTPTIALKPGSKAIDHVTSASDCTGTDQRGVPWPTPCDIGAIQAGDINSTTVTLSFPTFVGTALTATATVIPTDDGGTVTFSATLNGAAYGLSASCSNVTLAANKGHCAFTPNAAGTYTVTAVYSGDAIYGDSLGSASVQVLPLFKVP